MCNRVMAEHAAGFPRCNTGPQMEWLTTEVCCLAALKGSKIKGSAPAWSPEESLARLLLVCTDGRQSLVFLGKAGTSA